MDELAVIVSLAHASIGYEPLPGEPDYRTASLHLPAEGLLLPANPDEDPFEWSQRATALFRNQQVALFIPGTAFDELGTRHGRGAGWFDRFLSDVPRAWTRIGVCRADQFSSVSLSKEEWDEPMDWLLVETNGVWSAKSLSD